MNYLKNNRLSWLVTTGLIVISVFIYHSFFTPKVGYVRTGALLSGYKAMTDANKQFENEAKLAYSNLDTLRSRYIQSQGKPTLHLTPSMDEIKKYEETSLKQLETRRQELTKNILDKVNNSTKIYGEQHHYTIIFGATSEGSILYGQDSKDITDELLKTINDEYLESIKR